MSKEGKINRGLKKLKDIENKYSGKCPSNWADNADVREEIKMAQESLKPAKEKK